MSARLRYVQQASRVRRNVNTSMPRWDFYCEHCQTTTELAFPTYRDTEKARCSQCGGTLAKHVAKSHFVVTGYNAKNRYTKG